MTLLNVDGVEFSYGDNLPNPEYLFDLRCSAGDIVAITGRSGAGKSTFLNLLLGFLAVDNGKIFLSGRNITYFPPAQRKISAMFQKNNVFEHLSVLNNITLGISPNSRPDKSQEKLALDMLAKMGLAGFENRKTGDLSGGQMQRVALGRELLRETSLMVLDEPFNALDDETREIIQPLISQYVRDDGRAVLIVTHDLPDIEDLITAHYHIENGKFMSV